MQNFIRFIRGRNRDAKQDVSLEGVRWAYRLFLDRQGESEQEIVNKAEQCQSSKALREEFMGSDEFLQNHSHLYPLLFTGEEPALNIETAKEVELLFDHIQRTWETLGQSEPYWSVLTAKEFKSHNIQQSKDQFYQSGQREVEALLSILQRNHIEVEHLKTCLELGCGTGRTTYALAKIFKKVWAFDISSQHLQLAKEHLGALNLSNVSFETLASLSDLTHLPKVDLAYSILVLQHNPPPLMELMCRALLQVLNPGGIAFFQLPTYRLGYDFKVKAYLKKISSQANMEMHVLPQREIFNIIDQEDALLLDVLEDRKTGVRQGDRSNTFVVQKKMP